MKLWNYERIITETFEISTGDDDDEPTLHTDIATTSQPGMPDVQVF